MKILAINEFGKTALIESNFVPRAGDKVDLFYDPLPMVTVIEWPSKERLKSIGFENHDIDVVITVS